MNKIKVVKKKITTNLDQSLLYHDNKLIVKQNTNILLDLTEANSNISWQIETDPYTISSLIILSCSTTNNFCYTISAQSQLNIIHLAVDTADNITVNLEGEHAVVDYRYSTLNFKENKTNFYVDHLGNYTESNLINHGVTMTKEPLSFIVNAHVAQKSKYCVCNQDNKIIMLQNNNSVIRPNLLIDNQEIEANHSAYLGQFNKNTLFYLQSRGIPKKKCYELLLKGFLLGNTDVDKKIQDWFFHYLNMKKV